MSKKYCSRCDQTLDTALFGKSRARKDGLQGYCRECTNAYMAERRDEKRDEVLSYRREYAKEHREAINESHRKWRDKNRTTYNAYQRDWRASKHRKATVSSITARVNPDG